MVVHDNSVLWTVKGKQKLLNLVNLIAHVLNIALS